jgi:hypothetical protein
MKGCPAPHTRRAMAENHAGKTPCWHVFSDRLWMRGTQKPLNHMCYMALICIMKSQLIQKKWNIFILLAKFCDVWLPRSPSGWVKTPSLPLSTRLWSSSTVISPLTTNCPCQLVLGRSQMMFLSFFSKMSSSLDYQHSFNVDWVSPKFINNTTWHGLMVSRHIKVRLVFVEFVSDFLPLFKTWTGSLYTDHNILLNFANANLS